MKGLGKNMPALLTSASIAQIAQAAGFGAIAFAVSGSAMSPSTRARRSDALISARLANPPRGRDDIVTFFEKAVGEARADALE